MNLNKRERHCRNMTATTMASTAMIMRRNKRLSPTIRATGTTLPEHKTQ